MFHAEANNNNYYLHVHDTFWAETDQRWCPEIGARRVWGFNWDETEVRRQCASRVETVRSVSRIFLTFTALHFFGWYCSNRIFFGWNSAKIGVNDMTPVNDSEMCVWWNDEVYFHTLIIIGWKIDQTIQNIGGQTRRPDPPCAILGVRADPGSWTGAPRLVWKLVSSSFRKVRKV